MGDKAQEKLKLHLCSNFHIVRFFFCMQDFVEPVPPEVAHPPGPNEEAHYIAKKNHLKGPLPNFAR